MADVQSFIRAEMDRPFAWGTTDCCATADRWCQARFGFSFLDRYGRRHTSEEEALAWMAEHGGLQATARVVFAACGFFESTDAPAPGDLGVIRAGGLECLAIHSGRLWWSRAETGFIGARRPEVAWRID